MFLNQGIKDVRGEVRGIHVGREVNSVCLHKVFRNNTSRSQKNMRHCNIS